MDDLSREAPLRFNGAGVPVLTFVAALTRNQNPCPAPVKFLFRAVVLVMSVARELYSRDPPESMPLSVEEVDGLYCSVYFVGWDEDGLPMEGHDTVMEASSASTRMIPSLILSYADFIGLR